MSIRLYVMPMERNGNARGLKYTPGRHDVDPSDNVVGYYDPATSPIDWDWQHYGLHNWAIAVFDGPDAVVHAALALKPDVEQIPADLDSNVGGANRDRVRTLLEDAALPGQWVQNGTTWREIIRTVYGVIVLCKRVDGILGDGTSIGQMIEGNLSVQWQNIPLRIRGAVTMAGAEAGIDMDAEVTPTTIVRQVLRILGQHWTATPVMFSFNNLHTTFMV